MCRRQPVAVNVVQLACEWIRRNSVDPPLSLLSRERGVHAVERGLIDDPAVLAWEGPPLVNDFADVNAILEQVKHRAAAERLVAGGLALRAHPRLGANAIPQQLVEQAMHRTEREV